MVDWLVLGARLPQDALLDGQGGQVRRERRARPGAD